MLGAYLGWRKGFLRGVLGFAAAIVSLTVAILCAKPLARLLDKWFGFSGAVGALPNMLICGVVVYLLIWFAFFIVMRFVRRAKEKNKKLDKADKIGGIFLGIAKTLVSVSMFFLTLYLMSSVPFASKIGDWLLKGSVIGQFIYDVTLKIVVPIWKALEGAAGGLF